jgi:predicted small metal-binding protein
MTRSLGKRKYIDCRQFPNEFGCTLTISGNEKEVIKVAVRHAVEEHGHQDTPELRKQLRALLQNETNHRSEKRKKHNKLTKS